jgi:hypothetical protein
MKTERKQSFQSGFVLESRLAPAWMSPIDLFFLFDGVTMSAPLAFLVLQEPLHVQR